MVEFEEDNIKNNDFVERNSNRRCTVNMGENAYNDILRKHSKDLIIQDGKVFVDLLLNVHNSAINLSLIPFCALYCRSAKEFLCIENTGNEIEKEVKDIRDGLKIFTDKYTKGKKMVSKMDNQQNEVFKNKLRFPLTKILNIHLNLGVSFNEQARVVFNTQLANFYLNIIQNNEDSDGEHARVVGEKLGSEIAEILVKYCGIDNLKEKGTHLNAVPKYGYIDFNTNRNNDFFSKEFDKETNLIILHMLSTIGFVNNLLVPVFQDKNIWLLRIIYITAHNTWLGIKRINQHFEQNHSIRIKNLNFTDDDLNLFSTSFRNCMMHYDLVDKSECHVILQEWYDPQKPLYGLVESCFSGLNFNQYYEKIYNLSQKLEEYLLSYFKVNQNDIHWDWD